MNGAAQSSLSALFLDRDGVLTRIPREERASCPACPEFIDGAVSAVAKLSPFFCRVFIVTQQQAVGDGRIMEQELEVFHRQLCDAISKAGGRIDKIYVCTDGNGVYGRFRKPDVGMGLSARREFGDFLFRKSYMVGDRRSDMEFGKRLGMKTVLIGSDPLALAPPLVTDSVYGSLRDFAEDFLITSGYSRIGRSGIPG